MRFVNARIFIGKLWNVEIYIKIMTKMNDIIIVSLHRK